MGEMLMRIKRSKKLVATMTTTAILMVPTFQALANEISSNDQTSLIEQSDSEIVTNDKVGTGNHTITLITGDVVQVTDQGDGNSVVSVDPVADNSGGGVRIATIGEDTYVIPNSAMPYLAADRLDKELFNITTLIEDGYDDAKSSTLPVIVEYSSEKTRSIDATLTPEGSKKTHVLESINGASLMTEKKHSKKFWKDITPETKLSNSNIKFDAESGIEKVWLDGRVEATLDKSVPQIGATTAWASGFDGKGVKVAVLDTGIDSGHLDISGQLDEAVSFVPGEDVTDRHGHGTHVASTVLGTGAASNGTKKGVAPGSRLLVGKVLSNQGSGQTSWVIEGMEWAAKNAKVINMSLGSSEPSDGKTDDPMSQAVNRLSAETGALFVIAAGNQGGEGRIGSPGAADSALTVGAVDKSDRLANFTSMGPRTGDMGLKPDLSAPGVGIVAARSQYSSGTGLYKSLSGTSMATPHVAGAAAIIAQRHPDWTGAQIKDALMSSTKQLDGLTPYQIGTGRVDVVAALGDLHATGSVFFGFHDWPHEADKAIERTVTYSNDGDNDVVLNLEPTFTDAAGKPAPSGLLMLSATSITVPAKGKASVTVTVDPNLGALGARYQGQLKANLDGKTIAHTSMAMIKEDERYSLTLNAIDRDGTPAVAYVLLFSANKKATEYEIVNGTKEMRLPPGTYSAMSLMDVDSDTDHAGIALVGDPEIILNKTTTVDLDARKANEITANVPSKSEPAYRRLEYYRSIGSNNVNDRFILPVTKDKTYAVPTEEVETGKFEQLTRWRLIKPKLTINFNDHELDVIPQFGSTLLDGNYNFKTVYAGKGTTANYDSLDVKGKAVVVDRNDEITPSGQAAAALEAGAKLLIIANDKPTELYQGVRNQDGTFTKLAVASVSGTEGTQLVAAAQSGKLVLTVKGSPESPYLYDLVDVHEKAVPENVTYSPEEDELVKINATYKSDRPAPGEEFRYDSRPYTQFSVGEFQSISLPSVRTEWVSAPEGTFWYQCANVLDQWSVRGKKVSYKPGQRLDKEWFSPVIRPSFGGGYLPPQRAINRLTLNVPALADSGIGHTGAQAYNETLSTQSMKLYKGSTLVKNQAGQQLIAFVPQERTQYRLVNDVKRDPKRWRTSVQTHTAWTFWSEYATFQDTLPMLSLDYQVDTNMNGDARAGHSSKLELSAEHIANAIGAGNIVDASLEVSFDEGTTWEKVNLIRGDKGWITYINNPNKPGSFVSLKASAWDDAGNRIDQEIIKAYGLDK